MDRKTKPLNTYAVVRVGWSEAASWAVALRASTSPHNYSAEIHSRVFLLSISSPLCNRLRKQNQLCTTLSVLPEISEMPFHDSAY